MRFLRSISAGLLLAIAAMGLVAATPGNADAYYYRWHGGHHYPYYNGGYYNPYSAYNPYSYNYGFYGGYGSYGYNPYYNAYRAYPWGAYW